MARLKPLALSLMLSLSLLGSYACGKVEEPVLMKPPTPTPSATSTPEPLVEKVLLGWQYMPTEQYLFIRLSYDTNKNGYADLFETHTGYLHEDHVHLRPEVLRTTYDCDENGVIDDECVGADW